MRDEFKITLYGAQSQVQLALTHTPHHSSLITHHFYYLFPVLKRVVQVCMPAN
jgi:hypothetical protein